MKNTSETCNEANNANKVNKATVKLIPEFETTGKVNDVYADIKKTLGIDFVPKYVQGNGQ